MSETVGWGVDSRRVRFWERREWPGGGVEEGEGGEGDGGVVGGIGGWGDGGHGGFYASRGGFVGGRL